MNLPTLSEGAHFSPGHCHICGRNEGAMVDTHVDVPGDGRTYICTTTCLPLIAGLADYTSPEETQRMRAEIATHQDSIMALEAALDAERANKVLTVSDAIRFAEQRAVRYAEHDQIESPVRCTALRKDGTPCQAFANPGWNVCVAHSKRLVTAGGN